MDYSQALKVIYSFTNFEVTPAGNYSSKTFDLDRMEQLLAFLGNPERSFRSVHVAGTKGKGSTAAMIESVLRVSGMRTGFYTSPHLHTFRERIRLRGNLISKADVVAGIERLEPVVARVQGVTTFEVMTALALDYFARQGVEVAVLEVGLGGRLDATNVVTPLVSVITSISLDHTGILGNTLAQIAREKAGIIKPHIPVVSSPQAEEAAEVIALVAREASAPLTVVSADLGVQVGARSYKLSSKRDSLDAQIVTLHRNPGPDLEFRLPLGGGHQLANLATAIAALAVMAARGLKVTDEQLARGLESVDWKGRLEIMQRSPLLVVDGAHNGDSMHQLAHALQAYRPGAPIQVIFGASSDKDINGMFTEILPYAENLILTRSRNPRSADPTTLRELARPYPVKISMASDVPSAIRQAREIARPQDIICATGSLFLVAEAREFLLAERGTPVEKD